MLIWRGWVGAPPPWEPWLSSMIRRAHPDAEMRDPWSDLRRVDRAPLAHAVAAAPPAERARHESNLLRYLALDLHGGVWLDWDVVPLRPLDQLPPLCCAAVNGSAEGGIIAAPAGSMRRVLNEALLRSTQRGPWLGTPRVSGASVLAAAFDGPPLALHTHDRLGRPLVPAADAAALHLWASSR